MKKVIFTLLALMSLTGMFAQERMRIAKTDGTYEDFWVEGVKSIRFLDFNINPDGKVAEAVDLGLSVKWASWNLGASNEYEFGGYYHNGDAIAEKWDTSWRLPTNDEFEELKKNCTFEVVQHDDINYMKVTGKNGRYVIFPLCGHLYDSHLDRPTSEMMATSDGDYLTNEGYAALYGINGILYYNASSKYSYAIRPVCANSAVEPRLSISPESIVLGSSKGATSTLKIESNTDWTITGVPSWATFSSTSGYGNKDIVITAKEKYEGANDRANATVTIQTKSGGKKATLKLSQKGVGMSFSITNNSVKLASNAGATGTFVINTNFDFTIRNNVDWLEVTPVSGNTTTTVTVKAKTANPNTTERKGNIYVQNVLFGSALVEVTQAAGTGDILYEEPYVTWGTARSTVKNAVKNLGYSLIGESTTASDYYYLMYLGKHKELYNLYIFDSSQKLDQVSVEFSGSSVSVTEARDYLTSKLSYTYKGTNSAKTQFFHLSPDGKSYAVVYSYTQDDTTHTRILYLSESSVSTNAPRRATSVDGEIEFETLPVPKIAIETNSSLLE